MCPDVHILVSVQFSALIQCGDHIEYVTIYKVQTLEIPRGQALLLLSPRRRRGRCVTSGLSHRYST